MQEIINEYMVFWETARENVVIDEKQIFIISLYIINNYDYPFLTIEFLIKINRFINSEQVI